MGKFWIQNGTPQGSISTLFSLMINDVYADTINKMGVSLFADGYLEGLECYGPGIRMWVIRAPGPGVCVSFVLPSLSRLCRLST